MATASLAPSPHHNLHVADGIARPVLVQGPDVADRTWVYYAGDDGSVGVSYSVPDAELRTGVLAFPVELRLGKVQEEVATYRFEDVRDGSENDAILGAELHGPLDGTRYLRVTNVGDALDTLNAALDIISDWAPGRATTRERNATRSLRDKIAALVTA